jgi:hypothetical protein
MKNRKYKNYKHVDPWFIREELRPEYRYVPRDRFDQIMSTLHKSEFSNFTSASASEVEIINPRGIKRVQEEYMPLNELFQKFSHYKTGLPNEDVFYPFAKGKFCKSQGLTGAEKRACKKQIKMTCGNRPVFGRAKKEAWDRCVASATVTPQQAQQEEQMPSAPEQRKMSAGMQAVIGVSAVVVFGALVYGITKMAGKKSQPAQ